MARLVDELSKNPHTVQVSEIPGQGHWFNGVVDDPILQVSVQKGEGGGGDFTDEWNFLRGIIMYSVFFFPR